VPTDFPFAVHMRGLPRDAPCPCQLLRKRGSTLADVVRGSLNLYLPRARTTVQCLLLAGAHGGRHRTRHPLGCNLHLLRLPSAAHSYCPPCRYVGDNDMSEAAVPEVNPTHIQWSDSTGMHTTNNIPLSGIQALLKSGSPVIANVMQGHHFVLVTGWDAAQPDTLMVNDPGFDRQTYSYKGDVVGWRLFDMEMNKA